MTNQNDPFGKLTRDALGLDRTIATFRTAQTKLPGADILDRIQRDQRRLDELVGKRPDIFRDITRQQQAFSEMLAKRPNIFEEFAKSSTGFTRMLTESGAAAGAVEAAMASAVRLAGALPSQQSYERLINSRSLIPDHVIDALAMRAPMQPLIERLSARENNVWPQFVDQMVRLSKFLAEPYSTLPSRSALAAQFPSIVPPLRLPTALEIAGIDLIGASGLHHRDKTWAQVTAAQIAAIDEPWVRDDRPELAIEGFAAMKGLTEVVGGAEPSAPRVTQLVRADLGDYRHQDIADEGLNDPLLVSGLRLARGFDVRLASLPMALAGSVFATFGMVIGLPPQANPDELDEVIVHMFRQLERQLRAFIDASMKAVVGDSWIRQRVHRNIRDVWERRRQVDADAGRPTADLFDYADFSHYRTIIEQNDNWRDVFHAIFKVKTSIGETLARLSVIRNPVAHIRPLTVEDLLVLRVEGQRLYRWMGVSVP